MKQIKPTLILRLMKMSEFGIKWLSNISMLFKGTITKCYLKEIG